MSTGTELGNEKRGTPNYQRSMYSRKIRRTTGSPSCSEDYQYRKPSGDQETFLFTRTLVVSFEGAY